MKTILTTTILAFALTGCGGLLNDPSLDRTAGATRNAQFGDATMTNMMISTGQLGYAEALQARFESEVPSTVLFEFDSATLTPRAQQVLDRQASWMRQFPELGFSVYGYADAVGPSAYNERLGRARAEAVLRYLVSRGVPRSHLEALVSYGEDRLAVQTSQREVRNRRVITTVSGFDQRHPTVLDGRYAEIIYRDYVASAVPPSQLSLATSTGAVANN
ncbi:outer membrane protein OmpA-like peptidoglycan-associated protein [Hasllibacter halocynthiae]|uniref:Outer membrane protein OmpA-like peptidoglycan-associated protein n=1 Tax=Hasllibacter halocynthiae TaxID=595589 RepID=A0A2T0X9J5_9RHOB|nr:OmpA family protein [Hasllibacter halocynthiae]PRY95622.1 outer membrane protein OmpA-like peptidoglycan-associated protein [Hasllibacter halocynthiae]